MERNNNIERIIVRYLQNNITEDEMRLLMSWLNEDPANKEMFFQIMKVHDLNNTDTYPTTEYINESWERIANKKLATYPKVQVMLNAIQSVAVNDGCYP
jgi:hypothetical protein